MTDKWDRELFVKFTEWRHTGLMPLAIIDGYTSVLLEGAVGDLSEEQRRVIDVIARACRRAMDHWRNPSEYLHLYSDLCDQKKIIELKPVSLGEIIGEVVDSLEEHYAIDSIEVVLDDNLPLVAGSSELYSVIMHCILGWYHPNAYNNGIIHTITATLSADEHEVLILIRPTPKPEGKSCVYYPGMGIRDIAKLIVEQYGSQLEVFHTSKEAMVQFALRVWEQANK